jgi:hypothetical protein
LPRSGSMVTDRRSTCMHTIVTHTIVCHLVSPAPSAPVRGSRGRPERFGSHEAAPCQWPLDSPRWRSPEFPTGGHQGVITRVLQRLLALTAAIWHNHHSGQPRLPSLVAYDH